MLAVQTSLLDASGREGPGALADLVRRQTIGAGAWVDHAPGWLEGATALFERLHLAVGWCSERRPMYERVVDVPRLVCFFGEGAPLPDPVLASARTVLDAHYGSELGEPFRSAGMCLYRDGRDSVAWHGDTRGRGATHDTMVAILSLGATRRLLLRPRSGGAALRYELASGDLLVMGGSCQRTWEHAVPKTTRVTGPRISVQFRPRGVS